MLRLRSSDPMAVYSRPCKRMNTASTSTTTSAPAITFAVEKFFRFNRLINLHRLPVLVGLLVVKGFPWPLLIPSVVWLLLVALFISALVYLARSPGQQRDRTKTGHRHNLLLGKANVCLKSIHETRSLSIISLVNLKTCSEQLKTEESELP